MEKKELLYEGKAKKLYLSSRHSTQSPDLSILPKSSFHQR